MAEEKSQRSIGGRVFLAKVLLILFLMFAPGFLSHAEENVRSLEQGKKCFEKYVALGKNFNPEVAELYSDTALIQNTRTYPTGQSKVVKIPAPQYKVLIRGAMPLAKARGDSNEYSQVIFLMEKERVRVKAVRYSNLKKYNSPLSILFAVSPAGNCLIYEEISESRP